MLAARIAYMGAAMDQDKQTQLLAIMERLQDLPLFELAPRDLPVTLPQVVLLNHVARAPGCGVKEIAEKLHLSPPTISVGVHRLVRQGMLERHKDPDDRRARPLYLTEDGQTVMTQVRRHRRKGAERFLNGLDPSEQEQLLALMEKATRNAESKLKDEKKVR
jgi:DNA-binding MarR family transcriptional regulator